MQRSWSNAISFVFQASFAQCLTLPTQAYQRYMQRQAATQEDASAAIWRQQHKTTQMQLCGGSSTHANRSPANVCRAPATLPPCERQQNVCQQAPCKGARSLNITHNLYKSAHEKLENWFSPALCEPGVRLELLLPGLD
eukprot:1161489-Pelagomonas_calceolata.AAC.10